MSKAKNQPIEVAEGASLLSPELENNVGQAEQPVADVSSVSPDLKQEAVKVRVLQQCGLGRPNDVVEVSASDLKGFKESGLVDDSQAAVEYAKSLTNEIV